MTKNDINVAIVKELLLIAPDISLEDIDPAEDMRDVFYIVSMDFLTLVTALGKRFDLEMPEADYPKMRSFDALLDYLSAQTS